jgi:hypothetical protein
MLEIAGGILIALAVLVFWPLILVAAIGLFLVGLVVLGVALAYTQWGAAGVLVIVVAGGLSLAVSKYQQLHGLH